MGWLERIGGCNLVRDVWSQRTRGGKRVKSTDTIEEEEIKKRRLSTEISE